MLLAQAASAGAGRRRVPARGAFATHCESAGGTTTKCEVHAPFAACGGIQPLCQAACCWCLCLHWHGQRHVRASQTAGVPGCALQKLAERLLLPIGDPSSRWCVLALDLAAAVAALTSSPYASLRSVQLCANARVRSMYTSNFKFDLQARWGPGTWRGCTAAGWLQASCKMPVMCSPRVLRSVGMAATWVSAALVAAATRAGRRPTQHARGGRAGSQLASRQLVWLAQHHTLTAVCVATDVAVWQEAACTCLQLANSMAAPTPTADLRCRIAAQNLPRDMALSAAGNAAERFEMRWLPAEPTDAAMFDIK